MNDPLELFRELANAEGDVAKRFGLGHRGNGNGNGNGHKLNPGQWRRVEKALRDWMDKLVASGRAYPTQAYHAGIQQIAHFLRMSGVPGPSVRADRSTVEWLNRYTHNELAGAMDRYADQMKSAILYGLRHEVNPSQTAAWLYKATQDAKEDWRLIARTETARANALGRYHAAQQSGYDKVWIPPHAGECAACRELLANKIFDIDSLRSATNYKRKRSEWVPALPLHPRCRHAALPYVPEVHTAAQEEYARLGELGLDDGALDEMFESSGQLKPGYQDDPRLQQFFAGKTLGDPFTFALDQSVEKVAKGFFDNPSLDLDPLLWHAHRLKPSVTQTITSWWEGVAGNDPQRFSSLYLTGGEAGLEWGTRQIEHDPDLDVQIILDYDAYRDAHPTDAPLDDPALHALLVSRIKDAKQGVDVAPGLPLDAFVRREHSVEEFLGDIRAVGQSAWDIYGERWAIEPQRPESAEVYGARTLEGLGGALAAAHPEWRSLGESAAKGLTGLYDEYRQRPTAEGREHLQRFYTWAHDNRKASYESPEGERGLGQFIWQYLVNYSPLERVKTILS